MAYWSDTQQAQTKEALHDFTEWSSANRLWLKNSAGQPGFISFDALQGGDLLVHNAATGKITHFHSVDDLLAANWVID